MKRRLLAVLMFACALPVFLCATIAAEACIGIPVLDHSTVITNGGLLMTCPAGDGQTLENIGGTITITVRSMCPEWPEPLPIAGIPASDIWLWSEGMILCGGSSSSNADGPTDSEGTTTISGSVASGGYSQTVHVVVMGILLGEMTNLSVVSPDMNQDLIVDLSDFVEFSLAFLESYDIRADMNGDGSVNLLDFVLFAGHYLHSCN